MPARTTLDAGDATERSESSPATVGKAPRIGDLVAGKYRLERALGSGGGGQVFEARHTTLSELVAIKFLHRDAADDALQKERFLREAKASMRIQSEHVVRVYDVGTTNTGGSYLVMEHLKGCDLGALISQRGALPVDEAIEYMMQACAGLARAHALGIVHRDLKPSNLFVTRHVDKSALVKILDFGIAKSIEHGTTAPNLTDTRAVFGSPAYMSPEQIRGAKNTDPRSDVWSLGVVLFEMLAGVHPFEGDSSPAILASISADEPKKLRELRPSLPSELTVIVERCLRKNPAERVQSVAELATLIEPFADGGLSTTAERVRRMSLPPSDPKTKVSGTDSVPRMTTRAWATTEADVGAKVKPTTSGKTLVVGLLASATLLAVGYAVFPRSRAPETHAPSAANFAPAVTAVPVARRDEPASEPPAVPAALASSTPSAHVRPPLRVSPRPRVVAPTPATSKPAVPTAAVPAASDVPDLIKSKAAEDMR